MIRKILVATHGTENAIQAESYAVQLAHALNADLYGLYIIHKNWGSLVGIEWLHSSEKRMDFYRYAETELSRMADAALTGFVQRAERHGLSVQTSVRVGDPGAVIAEEAVMLGADLVIIGCDSTSRSEEYRAKISVSKLLKSVPCSVLRVKTEIGKRGEKIAPQENALSLQTVQL